MTRLAPLVILAALAATAFAGGRQDPVHAAIRHALSDAPAEQVAGIRALRTLGEPGLERLLEAREGGRFAATAGQWKHAIDQVAAQRDAEWSELFWHTDLEVAKAQAASEHKPILSLRMLGDLREATSCANSRFFRAILYSNPEIAERLDEDFVLHWSSERDVPQITIRYGDGRELHSTITGNSAHYVLDAAGRPLDVLPGLYTPDGFLAELDAALDLVAAIDETPDARDAVLRTHHAERRDADLERVRFVKPNLDPRYTVLLAPMFDEPIQPDEGRVPALQALPIAVGKGVVERPMVPFAIGSGYGDLLGSEDLVVLDEGTLHPRSIELMRSQQPSGPHATAEDVDALVARFTSTVQADSTWNRYVLHARVHDWFATDGPMDFETLNDRVYAEVFATPAGDPWLGLHDSSVYTGLRSAGIVLDGIHAN